MPQPKRNWSRVYNRGSRTANPERAITRRQDAISQIMAVPPRYLVRVPNAIHWVIRVCDSDRTKYRVRRRLNSEFSKFLVFSGDTDERKLPDPLSLYCEIPVHIFSVFTSYLMHKDEKLHLVHFDAHTYFDSALYLFARLVANQLFYNLRLENLKLESVDPISELIDRLQKLRNTPGVAGPTSKFELDVTDVEALRFGLENKFRVMNNDQPIAANPSDVTPLLKDIGILPDDVNSAITSQETTDISASNSVAPVVSPDA